MQFTRTNSYKKNATYQTLEMLIYVTYQCAPPLHDVAILRITHTLALKANSIR